MAPQYKMILITRTGFKGVSQEVGKLLKQCTGALWERGGLVSDIKSWGQRQLAYRIRRSGKNHYSAQYIQLDVHCSPPTLKLVEQVLRTSELVLRWMTLRERALPKLSEEARRPFRRRSLENATAAGLVDPQDLMADPAEAAKYAYRNLLMQRIFEGRSKRELLAEQVSRQRFADRRLAPRVDRVDYRLQELEQAEALDVSVYTARDGGGGGGGGSGGGAPSAWRPRTAAPDPGSPPGIGGDSPPPK